MQKLPLNLLSAVALAALIITPAVSAQSREPKNLQVFPKGTPRNELIPHMRNFSFALGVPCTYCHGTEEQRTSNLEGVDFSLDIKPTKTKAREMLRMVEEINSRLLAGVPHRSERNLEVSCFTCHSGVPLPEKIEDRVLRTIEGQGIDAALADYRQVRRRYHGSAAFNFGEQPLVEVASELGRRQEFAASEAICRLNLEFHSDSMQSTYGLAEALFAQDRKKEAKPLYEKVVAAWPWNQQAKRRLAEIPEPR